ncbi:MAG: hypothetical protein NT069_22985, partial [Planctomycetota bacterium]|nr:hypothetical protein [Planctomycetota bacterium]
REVEVLEDGDPEPVVLKVGPKIESAPGGFKIFIGLPLDRRVSLHFQRAPLVEVLTAACKAAAITLDLDEDATRTNFLSAPASKLKPARRNLLNPTRIATTRNRGF